MKMKKWAKLIAFILCIVMALSLFVACDNDENNGGGNGGGATPPDESIDVATAMEDILTKISSSYSIDGSKDIMVDVAGVIDYRKVDADGNVSSGATYNKSTDFAWQVVVRGNVSMNWESTDAQNYYLLEINDLVRETSVLQLYFEYQDKAVGENGETLVHNGSYIYASILGSDVVKINAFSMMQLVKQLVPGFGGEVAAADGLGDMDIMELLPTVAGMIFDEKVEFDGKSYTFTADINKVWELIYGLLSDGSTIEGAIGADLVTQVNDVIKELFGDLTYTEKGNDGTEVIVNVNNIATLVKYIDINMPKIGAKIKFDFTDKGIFKGLAASINVDPQGDDKGFIAGANFNALSVTNATYDKVEMLKGTFIEKAYVKAENRLTVEGFNLLKFQVNGEVILGASNPLTINADINPFVLLSGLTMDNIKDLGYINITLDGANVAPMNGKNIFTLHSDFSTGRMIVSLTSAGTSVLLSENIMGGGGDHLYFAGVYEFEAIPSLINLFGGVAQNAAFAAEEDSSDDMLTNLLETLISSINVDNLAEDGLVIKNIRSTIETLVDSLLVDYSAIKPGEKIADLLLTQGNNDIAIKFSDVNGFVYGDCDKIAETDVYLSNFKNPETALTQPGSSAKSDAIKTTLQYGEPFTIDSRNVANARLFPLTVTGMDGIERTIDAVYSFNTGYNPLQVGKQIVTVYYGMPTNFSKLYSSALIGGMLYDMVNINWPLYGCQSFQVEVEVLPAGIAGSEMLIMKGSTEMETGSNVASAINGILRYRSGDGRVIETAITSDMIYSETPILDNGGNIMYNGTWDIEIRRVAADGTIVASYPLTIESFGLQVDKVDVAYVGQDVKDLFNFSTTTTDKFGNQITEKVDIKVVKTTYINSLGKETNISSSSLFESGTTKLKYYSSIDAKYLTMTVEGTINGQKYTRVFGFTYLRPDNYYILANGRNTSTINTATKVDTLDANFVTATGKDGIEWGVRYNTITKKWELSRKVDILDENGVVIGSVKENIMKDITLEVVLTRTKNAANQNVTEVVNMETELVDGCLTLGTYKIDVTLNGTKFSRTNMAIKQG